MEVVQVGSSIGKFYSNWYASFPGCHSNRIKIYWHSSPNLIYYCTLTQY